MNVILFGPPGAGKGTQSKYLEKEFGLKPFSMGEALREEVACNTVLGQKIQNLIEQGKFATDEVVHQVLDNNLSAKITNMIFDGFPRKLSQVEMLNNAVKKYNFSIDVVIVIDISQEILINRITGRYSCKKCGLTYNDFYLNPRTTGVCDKCQCQEFVRRKDDSVDTLKKRYQNYIDETLPVIELMKQNYNVVSIAGDGHYQTIYENIKLAVNQFV